MLVTFGYTTYHEEVVEISDEYAEVMKNYDNLSTREQRNLYEELVNEFWDKTHILYEQVVGIECEEADYYEAAELLKIKNT